MVPSNGLVWRNTLLVLVRVQHVMTVVHALMLLTQNEELEVRAALLGNTLQEGHHHSLV